MKQNIVYSKKRKTKECIHHYMIPKKKQRKEKDEYKILKHSIKRLVDAAEEEKNRLLDR